MTVLLCALALTACAAPAETPEAEEALPAETAEEAKALYERCPRLLKEKVKAILIKSGFEEIVQ